MVQRSDCRKVSSFVAGSAARRDEGEKARQAVDGQDRPGYQWTTRLEAEAESMTGRKLAF